MKILIACDHIGQDGTGRFLTYLANEMTMVRDFEVALMLFHKEDSHFLTYLSKDVDVINLDLKQRLHFSIPKIFRAIVNYKPDICLFGYTQLLLLGYLTPLFHLNGIKVMFRDTIIPTIFHKHDNFLLNFFNKHAYHRFDCIIAQSDDMKNDLEQNWGCNPSKMVKINNPVDIETIYGRADTICPEELKNSDVPVFVSAGRLDEQKGYDIAIQRIGELNERIPSFKWLILGNGHLEDKLKSMVIENKLEDRIHFLGFKKNVPAYIKYSDGLMLSSRYEGFPNIVLESLALGKPVFSNNCPGGINEIIINGMNGIACDFYNQDSFERGLQSFMNTDFSDIQIQKDTEARYAIKHIMKKYELFFRKYHG